MSVAESPRGARTDDSKAGTHLELLEALGHAVPRGLDIQRARRIYVNRNLRMDEIDLIGFDMDYTLALYHQKNLETLSIQCTLDKLLAKRGYPEEIRQLALGDPAVMAAYTVTGDADALLRVRCADNQALERTLEHIRSARAVERTTSGCARADRGGGAPRARSLFCRGRRARRGRSDRP